MEQAQPEQQPLVRGEVEKLEKAIAEQRIYKAPDNDLVMCLRYCFMLVGIRGKNLPDDLERIFLMQFIREHYGGHTAAEIRLAFEMAITGKLDVDPCCYENFSVAYFAGIMNAFRTWASEQVRLMEKTKPPVEKVLTAEQKLTINCEYIAYKQKLINKLPCTFDRWIENKKKK